MNPATTGGRYKVAIAAQRKEACNHGGRISRSIFSDYRTRCYYGTFETELIQSSRKKGRSEDKSALLSLNKKSKPVSSMYKYIVYRIVNLKTKRVYIGSTSNFQVRKLEHFGSLRKGKHHNVFLQSDFKIYGETSFLMEAICDDFKTRQAMLIREYELILKTKKNNYNIDTDCPVVMIQKEGKGKWKSFLKPVHGVGAKEKKMNEERQNQRKNRVNDHPVLDQLIAVKEQRELRRKK